MRRPHLLAAPLAAAASLLLATAVAAGGWAQVTVTRPSSEVPVGTGSVIDLTVLQHGVTPVSWPRITVVASGPDGAVAHAQAVPATDTEGHYTANITFPAAGDWTLTFESSDLGMEGTATLTVGPVAAPPAAVPAAVEPATNAAPAATTTPAPATTEAPVSLLFAVVLAGLGVAFIGILVRERRAASMDRDAATARRVGS